MYINMSTLYELDRLHKDLLRQLRDEITAELGPINLNSPAQLAKALKAAVPGIKLTLREWTKAVGTEEDEETVTKREVLEREAHKAPIIEKVLEFRKYRTRHSTFIESVRDKHARLHGANYFIHPRYRTDVVETYRLSSQAPNGQNIPRKDNDDIDLSIKHMFGSRFKDGLFTEADQSQIEIRTAAWLSQDKKMLAAIESGEDIHRAMAAIMLNKDADEVTDEERQLCKARTFLILYGGGAAKLARDLKITRRAAQRLIDDYFDTFTGLRDYIQYVKDRVKVDLYVETPFGFRRSFIKPEQWDSPDGFRIERQAFNTIVQSTAACITYIAMIEAEKEMRTHNLKSVMIGQVHDSALVDTHPDEARAVAQILRQCMENAGAVASMKYGVPFTVPLKCDVEAGPTWATAQTVAY
jgi:DNA polymerase-1